MSNNTVQTADTRFIDDDLFKFVDQNILPDPQEDVLFLGWADIYYLDRKFKPRMLVFTHFRLNVLKESLTGYSLRQTFLFLHLSKLHFETANNGETGILTLSFDDDPFQKDFGLVNSTSGEFKISYPMDKMRDILFPILSSVHAVRHNRPKIDISSIPDDLLQAYRSLQPVPDDQDGILASYLAECDRCLTPKRLGVLNYILSCFQIRDTTLNLSHIFKTDSNNPQQQRYIPDAKDLPRDVLAIISSIRNFPYFDAILSFDIPLKEALIPIASVFDVEQSSYVKLLAITGAKFNRKSVDAFANGFSKRNHALESIMFSNCDLGDYGIITICDALKKAEKPMESLSLAECGFSYKGFAAVVELATRDKIKQSLTTLDVHGNKLGKGSTPSIITLLNCYQGGLRTLNIANCDIDVEILFRELSRAPLGNTQNVAATLCSLDISGHRLSNSTVKDIIDLVKKTRTLTEIKFQSCNISAQNMFEILSAAYNNPNKLEFNLDFSKNNLGSKGAIAFGTSVMKLFETVPRPPTAGPNDAPPFAFLQSLDLSDNNIGMDGLRKLCPMLSHLPVNALFLDNNYKPGLFKESSHEFHLTGVALSDLLQENKYLHEFSICGDDNNYALTSAIPTMLRRIENVTHLTALDIAGNRCGDEVIDEIARMIRSPTCQISNFSIDANRFSLDGFKRIYRIVHDAPASRVFTMEPLASDAERISKTLKMIDLQEFHLILTNLENLLEQREQLSAPQEEDPVQQQQTATPQQSPSNAQQPPQQHSTSSPSHGQSGDGQISSIKVVPVGGADTPSTTPAPGEDTFYTTDLSMEFINRVQVQAPSAKRPSILRSRRQSISSGGTTILPDTIAQRRLMTRTMTGATSIPTSPDEQSDSEIIYQPTSRPSFSNNHRPYVPSTTAAASPASPSFTPPPPSAAPGAPSTPQQEHHSTSSTTSQASTPSYYRPKQSHTQPGPPTVHQLYNQPPPATSARPSISRPSIPAAAQSSNYQPPPPQHLPRTSNSSFPPAPSSEAPSSPRNMSSPHPASLYAPPKPQTTPPTVGGSSSTPHQVTNPSYGTPTLAQLRHPSVDPSQTNSAAAPPAAPRSPQFTSPQVQQQQQQPQQQQQHQPQAPQAAPTARKQVVIHRAPK